MWERIIHRILREKTSLGEEQFGFMPGRGTTDTIIFAARQVVEKTGRCRRNCEVTQAYLGSTLAEDGELDAEVTNKEMKE